MITTPAFLEAVTSGNRQQVLALLEANPALLDSTTESGLPVILMALYYNEPGIAALLSERGADLDIFSATALGDTARLASLITGHPQRVNAFSADGFQPLHLAAFFGRTQAAALLLEHGAQVNTYSRNSFRVMPLHSALAGRHVEISHMLLEHGAEVNAPQAEGFTPLMEAAQNGQAGLVELLLARGADPSARNAHGLSAAEIAANSGHAELASRLSL